MGHQLCVKNILNNYWISGVPILKGLIRLLKRLKFCLVNTEATVKIIWSSGLDLMTRLSCKPKGSDEVITEYKHEVSYKCSNYLENNLTRPVTGTG